MTFAKHVNKKNVFIILYIDFDIVVFEFSENIFFIDQKVSYTFSSKILNIEPIVAKIRRPKITQ